MIYVVTPVHNRRDVTARFLECLTKQRFRDFATVIVDDGSTDGTSELIRGRFPEVIVLRGDGDLWWSGGTNLGLKYVMSRASDDDLVLVINDDVEIAPDYLEKLFHFSTEHPNALVNSVVVDADDPDMIWDGGRTTNWWTASHRVMHKGRRLSDFPSDAYFKVDQLTGRGMLAPVRVFREVGLYDDRNFKHRGDTELPVRASRKGFELLVYYGAIVGSHVNLTPKTERGIYHLSDFREYFFDFRSSGWIMFRFNFARKTAISPLQFLSFLVFDLGRITGHFFRGCLRSLRTQT